MKLLAKSIILALFVLAMQGISYESIAQVETEPVQLRNKNKYGPFGPVEEFSVLKINKTVRHGSYVKYWPSTALSSFRILETGTYDQGLKEGEWRYFSQRRPWNKLVSKGQYHAGLATDLWLYYWYMPGDSNTPQKIAANPQLGKTGVTITLDDTTALVQAKGVYELGKRVGMWTFFDRNSTVIQKHTYSTGKLLFNRSEAETQPSIEALSLNHPLLYAGGKAKLVETMDESIDQIALLNLGKIGDVECIFSVDSTGTQVAVGLVTGVPATKYEKFIVDALAKMPGDWLPSVVNGKSVAATYRVKITSVAKDNPQSHSVGVMTTYKALGD